MEPKNTEANFPAPAPRIGKHQVHLPQNFPRSTLATELETDKRDSLKVFFSLPEHHCGQTYPTRPFRWLPLPAEMVEQTNSTGTQWKYRKSNVLFHLAMGMYIPSECASQGNP